MTNMIIQIILIVQQVNMADTMRSEGKIYVVVIIFLLILLALFYYMFRIEKKIDKIEQNKK
jgi:uncharacterized membrane protein